MHPKCRAPGRGAHPRPSEWHGGPAFLYSPLLLVWGGNGGMNGKNGCVSSIFHHDFKKAVPPGY